MKHGGEEFRRLAEDNTILLGYSGSTIHGVTTGDGDIDQMGVAIEPPEYVIGNKTFEQYQFRTQPEHVRSGKGDLDLTIYSLRKWARLAAQGNPTVLMLMFVPDAQLLKRTAAGEDLQAHPERFISRQAAARFGGYLAAQKERLVGLRSQRTNRPELVETLGWDTKYGFHMVRLGIQGVELLTTGRITLPMPEPERTWLTELRRGEHSKEEALARADDLLDQLNQLERTADWPASPDHATIDRWLVDTYTHHWSKRLTFRRVWLDSAPA